MKSQIKAVTSVVSTGVLALALMGAECSPPTPDTDTWKKTVHGEACATGSKQILILPAGYTTKESFSADYDQMLSTLSSAPASAFTTAHADSLCYVALWIDGGSVLTTLARSPFNAYVTARYDGKYALALNPINLFSNAKVKANIPTMSTFLSIAVLFDTTQVAAVGGKTPEFVSSTIPRATIVATTGPSAWDIAVSKIASDDLSNPAAIVHELAQSALGFGDESIVSANNNLPQIDATLSHNLSFTSASDTSPENLSSYDVRFSEILGANSYDNLDVISQPARVMSANTPVTFSSAGGLGFGSGINHEGTSNVMGDPRNPGPAAGQFAWTHTAGQNQVIGDLFMGTAIKRTNDRIRIAGPTAGSQLLVNSLVIPALIFDADHDHRSPRPPLAGAEANPFSNCHLSKASNLAALIGSKRLTNGDPDRIRTCDPLLRRQMLYPTELRDPA